MLNFTPITIDSLNDLLPFMAKSNTRSCDYTPGNLIMWTRFMNYRYAIEQETLFIASKSQMNMNSEAFLTPIGDLPLEKSIGLLQEHCKENAITLRLTAVPEEFIGEVRRILPSHACTYLPEWSDYIYDAQSLSTLQGKALNKKRNRYNKFIAEQPTYQYNRCTLDETKEVIRFLASNRECQHNREENMRCYEQWQCIATVGNLVKYNQPAGVLRVDGRIAAFTLGEIFGDTLFVHIEKASRDIVGASEAINRLFVNDILAEHPEITHINREEDLGDPGLRQVKRAYAPKMMLNRYEIYHEE